MNPHQVFSSSFDKTIKCWDLRRSTASTPLCEWNPYEDAKAAGSEGANKKLTRAPIFPMCFVNDGLTLCASNAVTNELWFYSPDSGALLHSVDIGFPSAQVRRLVAAVLACGAHRSPVRAVAPVHSR